jgi:hypothetical protein
VGGQVGLSTASVLAALHRRGVKIRENGDYLPPIDRDAVRRMHAEGIRVDEMCRRLGVGRRRVHQALDDLGLPRFAAGNPRLVKTTRYQDSPEGVTAA